ncbi:MAG: DUF2335 domain-containing protein [Flavobacteriales bacterium]|nr:DUF2335 domain-containing protein [Flavobacteriales bacterium]
MSKKPKQQIQETRTVTQIQHHQGPIPSSVEMQRYEEILPGAADRILRMAENQSRHRQEMEMKVVKTDNFKSTLGAIFGFVAVIATLVAGSITALRGQPIFGGGISLGGLAILGAAFYFSRKAPKK